VRPAPVPPPPAILVGHSPGAIVAIAVAADAPEAVRTVVLEGVVAVATAAARPERAARLAGPAAALRAALGTRPHPRDGRKSTAGSSRRAWS
jgi:pimeloyl-ACP methyl ester carboxylesterase